MSRPVDGDLRVRVLGSGTSTGVPMIGCSCPVCTSEDPRNRRLRCSLLLEWAETSVLVDTTPDLRQQALRAGIRSLDAVLWTHPHADHIFGFDDLRSFGFGRRTPLPGYASPATLARIRRAFAYAFEGPGEGGRLPRVDLRPVEGAFEIGGRRMIPVPLWHGSMEVTGWRVGRFAYCTDCHEIPPKSRELLAGVDALILDGLREKPHPTHLSIGEAIEVSREIGARRTWLIHMTHHVDHARVSEELPDGIELAYDGLEIDVDG